MKLFYFGSVCSPETFNETVARSRVKPSASAQSFEYALIKGFSAHPQVELTIASAESTAPWPRGGRLFLRKREDMLTERARAQILPALNLPGIKQACHAAGAEKQLRAWLTDNQNDSDKCVLLYGLYPAVVQKLLRLCKQHGCKICAVITDVPSTMFTYTSSKSLLKALFARNYRAKAMALQGQFDGYIYLTEAMQEEVAPDKPFIVVETIVDCSIFDAYSDVQKASPPALMYAGALYRKYGVDTIVESYEKVQTPCELWLFGSGDYEEAIKRKAAKNPRIRFFGRVSREEVLRREKEATLLLNIRNAEDEYTKYSFPSKMVEYMLSGTPLLTTKLPGVPDEYDAYCYTIVERRAQNIAAAIDGILQDENLQATGVRARDFVTRHKNGTVQAGKIIDFLKRQMAKG